MRIAEATLRKRLGDRDWRLSHLYRIVDRHGRERTFRPNAAQQALLADMHSQNLILKARQLGFTTLIQILMLDACLFTPNLRAGTIAHRLEDAEAIFRDRVKFAYSRLPAALRKALPARQSSKRTLSFANNSELRVGTSLRGGTFQMLHVSEFGKLSVQYPDKAREIRAGALNTVAPGRTVWIESTAEGQDGAFYDMVQQARALQRQGVAPGPLDFRFHFFPWWQEPAYKLRGGKAPSDPVLARYFAQLRATHDITLKPEQQAWYARKLASQGADMRREYPSTPDEAFEVALEGAYYGEELARADTEGRVREIAQVAGLTTDTWWDLGIDDATAIWLVQRVGDEVRVVDYIEASGEGLPFYARRLARLAVERGYVYGAHIAPHDIRVRELGSGNSRLDIAAAEGIRFRVCPQHAVADGIAAVRQVLGRCWFDVARCAAGLKALRAYRREWDGHAGTWKARPRHDWSSHAADAFRTGVMGSIAKAEWGPLAPPDVGTIA